MSLDQVDFASLLCSRLCHDLLSPVGALNNGLELMADETDPEMRQRCFELLEQSARTSANKLKFFRLAFGSAGGYGNSVPTLEAQAALQGLINERTRLEWLVAEHELPKSAIKTLLNLSLIAVDAMVRGGQLDIGCERREGAIEVVVRAAGEKLHLDSEIQQALEGRLAPDDITSRTAAAWMTYHLATANGGSVMVSSDPGLIIMGALLKPD